MAPIRLLAIASLLTATLSLQAAAPDEEALPEGARLRLGTNRLRHGGPVQAVAYSSDGKLIVSTASDRIIRVWNAQTGKLVSQTEATPSVALAIRFSPDNKLIASNDFQCDARVTDALTGKLRWLSRQYNGSCLAWSPDGKMLAAGRRDGLIRLYDAADGKVVRTLSSPGGAILAVAFSADGDTLMSTSSDGILRRWETKTGNLDKQFPLMKNVYWGNRTPAMFAFSADGKLLAASGPSSALEVWSTTKAAPARTLGTLPSSGYLSPCFSADGRFLATACTYPSSVSIWGVGTGRELRSFASHNRWASAVALSPDAGTVCFGLGAALLIQSTSDGKPLLSDEMSFTGVKSVAFLAGGAKLVSFHEDGSVNAWDTVTGKHLERLPERGDVLHEMATLHGGKAVRLMTPPLTWLDWEPGGRKKSMVASSEVLRPLSPDGKTAVRIEPGKAYIHDIESGKDLREFVEPPRSYSMPVWSPEGQRFVWRSGANQELRAWDVAQGRPVATFPPPPLGPQNYVPSLLSPGGRLLVQANNEVRVWETASGRDRQRLPLPGTQLASGVFTRDGRTLILGLMSGEVLALNLDTGKEVLRRQAHRGPIRCVRLSPDGNLLATASDDTTVLLWDAAPFLAPRPAVGKLTQEEVVRWWDELAAGDPAKGFAAVRAMSDAPADAIPMIKAKLEPIEEDVTKRIAKPIVDLDAKRFQQREKAMRELAEIGSDAEMALAAALPAAPSVDAKRRIEELLKQLKGQPQEGRLRGLRAVEVLERAGTPAAIEVLKALAAGAPEAWLTREARAALDRR